MVDVFKLSVLVVPLFGHCLAIVLIKEQIPIKAMRYLVVDYWTVWCVLTTYQQDASALACVAVSNEHMLLDALPSLG